MHGKTPGGMHQRFAALFESSLRLAVSISEFSLLQILGQVFHQSSLGKQDAFRWPARNKLEKNTKDSRVNVKLQGVAAPLCLLVCLSD